MNKIFLLLLIMTWSQTSFAYKAYVSDDLTVHLRTGPSVKYRVAASLKSGETFTVIEDKRSLRFVKIKLKSGRTLWIARKHIKSGMSHKLKSKALEKTLANNLQVMTEQADEIHRLNALLNEQKIKNDDHSNTQSLLNSQISSLHQDLEKLDDKNLIRWFTHTSVVTIIALFLVFVTAAYLKHRRRNYIYYDD